MVNKFRLDKNTSFATKEAISRTLEIANNYAGEISIEVLPLSKVELDPENNRDLILTLEDAVNGINKSDPQYEQKKQDWKSLESLAKTIRDDKLINPIYVYRFGNKCRLIAGERRTLASAIAGKKEIIARIAEQRPIGTKLKILQWIENNERSDLQLTERLASLEAIIQEYKKENPETQKITAKLLGDLTGMSLTQTRRYLLILQSNSEIKKAINSGKIENIKIIELIVSVKKYEDQITLLKAAIDGRSYDEMVALKKDLEKNIRKNKVIRGRKITNIRLGAVKPVVAKLIVNALLNSKELEKSTISKINNLFKEFEWNDVGATEKAFKKIISIIDIGVRENE